MRNIILFGASDFGKKALKYYESKDDVKIIAFCDNDLKKHGTLLSNIKVISPLEIKNLKYDEIVITSLYDIEIYNQLVDMGIEKDLIKTQSINSISSSFENSNSMSMAEELLIYICAILNANGIEYHIDHGTLLGIVRDDALLPWDKDIDFAVESSQMQETLECLNNSLQAFKSIYCKNNNWVCHVREEQAVNIDNNFIFTPVTLKIFNDSNEDITNSFDLDIKFKYHYNNNLYWRVGIRTLMSSADICFPSTTLKFKNSLINVPSDSKKYLTLLYGDWKTPIKEWSYSQYTNIEKNSEDTLI